jgi:hypothetical protein
VNNTTSIDDAVELLIAEPEAQDNNPSDAIEAAAEPTDESQSETVDEVAESQDAVEASDEFDDVEIDDDDQPDATEDTNLFTVKVNGRDENWTLDQLKQSAAGQGYINQRMQEIAQVEKQYKEQSQHLAFQQQQAMQLIEQAQNGSMAPPVAPVLDYEQDPVGSMQERARYDDAKAKYDQLMQQAQHLRQQRQAQNKQQHDQYLSEQAELVKQHIPEIADPDRGAKIKADLVSTGQFYGFTSDEMAGVADSRYVHALNDARKWRDLQSKRKAAKAKGDSLQPVRAGTKRRADGGDVAIRKKAQARLQQTGSIEDAIGLIL